MSTITAAVLPEKSRKVFFENLNGVRAIAAVMVVISHIELHKADFGIPRIHGLDLFNFGKVGVSIFFALSGFLITYLLLEEKRNYVKVNFRAFYSRRILRIWPLYFLVLFFGYFIYPKASSSETLWLSIFFLPNLAFCLKLLPGVFDPIWSIGTEEQFYIFHPHFFRFKKLQHLLYALVLFIVLFFVLFFVAKYFSGGANTIYTQIFYYARFDNMMVGAIVAVLYFNKKHKVCNFKFQYLFDLCFNRYVQMLLLTVFAVFIVFYMKYTIQQGDMVIATLSALLIVNLCEPSTSIYALKGNKFQFIGTISYGIYLLHKFPLFLILYLIKNHLLEAPVFVQNALIYGGTIVATIAIASVSYYGYEKPFLNIKKRYQKITQG